MSHHAQVTSADGYARFEAIGTFDTIMKCWVPIIRELRLESLATFESYLDIDAGNADSVFNDLELLGAEMIRRHGNGPVVDRVRRLQQWILGAEAHPGWEIFVG